MPRIAEALRDHGRDAVHVSDVGLATATDTQIVTYAEADVFVVVTADTDFPMLVALRRATSPSIVLLRRVNDLSPDEHIDLLLANLPAVTADLHRGAIVSIAPDHLRVRDLPLGLDATSEYRGGCWRSREAEPPGFDGD